MVAFVRKIEKNTKLKGSVKYVRFVSMFSYHGIEMSSGDHFNSEGFQMEKGVGRTGGGFTRKRFIRNGFIIGGFIKKGIFRKVFFLERGLLQTGLLEWGLLNRGL